MCQIHRYIATNKDVMKIGDDDVLLLVDPGSNNEDWILVEENSDSEDQYQCAIPLK